MTPRNPRTRRSERGAVLVAGLLILALLSLLGATALLTAQLDTKALSNQIRAREAFFAAEAGLEAGLQRIYTSFANGRAVYDPLDPPSNTFVPSGAAGDVINGADYNQKEPGVANTGYLIEVTITNPQNVAAPGEPPLAEGFNTPVAFHQLGSIAYVYQITARATSNRDLAWNAAHAGNEQGVTSQTITETVRVLETPVVQYFAFYDDDLSWSGDICNDAGTQRAWGRVHTNGRLHLCPDTEFTFQDTNIIGVEAPNILTAHSVIEFDTALGQGSSTWPNNPPTVSKLSPAVHIEVTNTTVEDLTETVNAASQGRLTYLFASNFADPHVVIGADVINGPTYQEIDRIGTPGNPNPGFYERASQSPTQPTAPSVNTARPNVDGMRITADGGALRIELALAGQAPVDVTTFVHDYMVNGSTPCDLQANLGTSTNPWPDGATMRADFTAATPSRATTVDDNPLTDAVPGSIVYSPESPVDMMYLYSGATAAYASPNGRNPDANPWYPCVLEVADRREGAGVDFTVIDMQLLQNWYRNYVDFTDGSYNDSPTLANRQLLIYVTRTQPASRTPVVGSGVGALQAVKIIGSNAGRTRGTNEANYQKDPTLLVPTTVASNVPVYIEGDYNASHHSSGNMAPDLPSLIVADAVTVLSNNWGASNTSATWNQTGTAVTAVNLHPGAETVVNTAIVAGRFDFRSGGSGPEAGLQNLVRFLEDWNGNSFILTGSLVSPWFSQQAGGAFDATHFSEPNRRISWDVAFTNPTNWPPYSPAAFSVERRAWQER